MSPAPVASVGRVSRLVGETLADERISRNAAGRLPLGVEDERELARSVVVRHLDALAAEHLANGVEPLDAREETDLLEAVLAKVLGLGRIQPLLDNPMVNDIHIRGSASTRLKLIDGRRIDAEPVVDSDDELVDLVRIVATRLGRSERRFDAANPELNLQLPDGSRLFATMEVSARPSVIIRKHRFELSSLAELEDRGLMDRALHGFLAAAVRARRNIVICGGTGTGKTTMLRALLNEVPADERIVTIEDAYELGLDRFEDRHPDHDMLQSRPANIEGRGAVTMLDLTKMALRMDPDRVIVGEVRGGEAFPMLLAMSQGNNGSMCTMHADSTRTVFPKLAAYVSMAETGLPVDTVNLLLATALHFVVHIEVIDGVRRIASVREVVDADGSRIVSNEVFRPGRDGCAVPGYPIRDATLALLEAHEFDVSLLDQPDGWWSL
ncbi:MAG: Type secretion system hydrolase TadA/VirB11/CpaF, TadA subfamily [Ilumatobacteraceae bacterium]|nr:Type secretion system hydrolase TadA/VirB11/CpaF, TadA subfamily [Ilumatobacteraceae bacterium]